MSDPIPALLPRTDTGHQFVCYADSCSGVPGTPHEATFAAVNAVVARLDPQPKFICFPGDEIIGLTADDAALRQQWAHWFDHEMAWLDRAAVPLYHTTGNHTTYNAHSEAVYREVMAHLPSNGPPEQEKLSYFVRRGNLLMVFVHTLCAELGGEGYVERAWLAQTLAEHADAKHKLVFGHHPVFPVNGYVGEHARNVDSAAGAEFWALLVEHGVMAYVCSHILAFDVQVHQGVLQILTAGAGTAHRMPEGVEYLHCVQAALDDEGLRYQVLDTDGMVREWLQWPPPDLGQQQWPTLTNGVNESPLGSRFLGGRFLDGKFVSETLADEETVPFLVLRLSGTAPPASECARQTMVSAFSGGHGLAPLWIGLAGRENQLIVSLAPTAGRSPHLWHGPMLTPDKPFAVEVAIHGGMGPGGILWRWQDGEPWSSMSGTAAWGAERLTWPDFWSVGFGQHGEDDAPFRGKALSVSWSLECLRVPSR